MLSQGFGRRLAELMHGQPEKTSQKPATTQQCHHRGVLGSSEDGCPQQWFDILDQAPSSPGAVFATCALQSVTLEIPIDTSY